MPDSHPCPICNEPLREAERHAVRAEICSEHGVWMPAEELERALRMASRKSRVSQSKVDKARSKGIMSGLFWGEWALLSGGGSSSRRERVRPWPTSTGTVDNAEIVPDGHRNCPDCGEMMGVDARDNAIIDVCDAHGVWLDTDELDGLVQRARGRSRSRSTRRLRRAEREGKVDGMLWGWFAFLR